VVAQRNHATDTPLVSEILLLFLVRRRITSPWASGYAAFWHSAQQVTL
jgi:hypothetical protein